MSAMLVDGIFPEVHGKDYVTVPFYRSSLNNIILTYTIFDKGITQRILNTRYLIPDNRLPNPTLKIINLTIVTAKTITTNLTNYLLIIIQSVTIPLLTIRIRKRFLVNNRQEFIIQPQCQAIK